MKCSLVVLMGILLMGLGLMSGCAKESQTNGALSVSQLLDAPLYDTQVSIYGEVSLLGELRCPCFELTSGGRAVQVWTVWYDSDVAEGPTVSVNGIQNGDQVIVAGELQTPGEDSLDEFWASRIEKAE